MSFRHPMHDVLHDVLQSVYILLQCAADRELQTQNRNCDARVYWLLVTRQGKNRRSTRDGMYIYTYMYIYKNILQVGNTHTLCVLFEKLP